jgi:hypothetical protein
MDKLKERATSWLLSLLDHVGMPSVLLWSFQRIRQLFSGAPERYLQFILQQSRSNEWVKRFFAGHECHVVYRQAPKKVLDCLRRLSGDEKEIIREGAARSWSNLLERDFGSVFKSIQTLAESDQYECRYTAALAPVRYYDEHATDREQERIRSFWNEFEDDPRKGLANLVRSQILEKREIA